MKIIRTTEVADKVLKQFTSRWKKINFNGTAYVEPYQNGREHGWALNYKMNRIAFSEYRNSDQIVVYYGPLCDFSLQGNVPSDKVYEHREIFNFDEVDNVVQFILDQFV
jgi:hypothetical protein